MRRIINRKIKTALVAGILFYLIFAISAFSVTAFASAQESSENF